MPFRWSPREHVVLGLHCLKWSLISSPVGAIIGSAVALFLWALDRATFFRWTTDRGDGIPWLLFFLPIAGIAIVRIYQLVGKSVEGGNNLIVEQIHEPGGGVPGRMAPLVLLATIVTHLFGGSAGREGTAVQMGGSIASTVARRLGLNEEDTRTLLMAGVAAGFGAVFGTPLTGAVFAAEVLSIGLIEIQSILPCLIASVIGDWTTTAWGIHHTQYHFREWVGAGQMHSDPGLHLVLLLKVAIASVAFGLAGVLFAELAHGLSTIFKQLFSRAYLRPVVGGLLVIGLAHAVGPDYLGLGVVADPRHPHQVSIVSCFHEGGATPWSWWWKLLFTAITLSSGFKGGEVTPLFFIGAALGNTMARILGAPVDLFARLGFVAVFAGATNTPLACTIMGLELFAGGQVSLAASGLTIYLAAASFVAYLLSGHSGIYLSQRVGSSKISSSWVPPDTSLRTIRELQPAVAQALLSRLFAVLNTNQPSLSEASLLGPDDPVSSNGGKLVPHRHKVMTREIGQVRIYMTPGEKRKGQKLGWFFAKPLYQEIVDAAKSDGIPNANVHHTHYGYSAGGQIQSDNLELPNPQMNLCVELIGPRNQLELFCRKHGALLKGKVIVYKHMEHWDIGDHDVILVHDVPQEELDVDVEDPPPGTSRIIP